MKKTYRTIVSAINQRPYAFTFLFAFLITFTYLNIVNNQTMLYDVEIYFGLSKTFVQNEHFSVFFFPATFRGVVFPLILFFFNSVASLFSSNIYMGWRIMISLLLAATITVLPSFFTQIKKDISMSLRLLPLACILFFWYGLLNYILSDFVALSFLVLGVFFFHKSFNEKKARLSCLFAFLSGVLLYAAYNTRTIYLFSLIVVAVLFFMFATLKKTWTRRYLISILCVVVGFLALGSVQVLVNYHHLGIFSLGLVTTYGEYDSLFEFQITEGMRYTQYETYIGATQYPAEGLKFVDPAGNALANSITKFEDIFLSPTNIISLIGTYIRHFINMLNPVFAGGAYISDLRALKIHRSLINYTFLFIVVKHFQSKLQSKKFKSLLEDTKNTHIAFSFAVMLLIPCLAINLGAVEQRFFLPFYLLIYSFLAYCVNYRELWKEIKQRPLINAVSYITIYLILLAQWANSYALTAENIRISVF